MAEVAACLIGCRRFLRERDVPGWQALRTGSKRRAALRPLPDTLSTIVAVRAGVWRRRSDLLQPLCPRASHLSHWTTCPTRLPRQLSPYATNDSGG